MPAHLGLGRDNQTLLLTLYPERGSYPTYTSSCFDGRIPAQVHGPGAIQTVGLDFPEERAATTGRRNPLTEAVISPNEAGT